MKIDRANASNLKAKARKSEPKLSAAPTAPEVKDQVKLGSSRDFQQMVTDFGKFSNSNGMVPLIVSSLNAEQQKAAVTSAREFSDPKSVEALPLVQGFVAEVRAENLQSFLTNLPASAHVGIDADFKFAQPEQTAPPPAADLFESVDIPTAKVPTVTSKYRLAGLDKVWAEGYTGKGQTGVVIDSGVFPHPDLKSKLRVSVDFTDPTRTNSIDTLDHGTNTSGIMLGDGTASKGEVMGVAPDAELVSLRIGSISDAIKALQWCIENKEKEHIGVVNMSLGDIATMSYKMDPFAQAVQKAIDAGVWVVVSAGNNGVNDANGVSTLKHGTITTPGDLPDAITIGAIDDHGSPDIKAHTIAPFSSEGPTLDGDQKPNYVANGVNAFAPLSPGSTLDQPTRPHVGQSYMALDGSSQAAPVIAGFLLLLRQANPGLTLAEARQIMDQSAQALANVPAVAQGKGEVQADRAMALNLAMLAQKSNSTATA